MRAFLSDPTLTDAKREYERDTWHQGAPSYIRAEREARAILSETEPESRHSSTFAPAPYYQPWDSRSERSRMISALAESLAAFVELG